jgi:hypothetical protein
VIFAFKDFHLLFKVQVVLFVKLKIVICAQIQTIVELAILDILMSNKLEFAQLVIQQTVLSALPMMFVLLAYLDMDLIQLINALLVMFLTVKLAIAMLISVKLV